MAEPKSGATPPADGKFSLISNEKLVALYTNLLKFRRTARQSGNGKFAAMRGREAAVVGTAIDLGVGDVVCSREHGLLTGFADGETIEKLLFTGNGRSLPRETAHAIGTALTNKTKKNGKVAVMFAEEQEQFREALHVATVHALPMIFVHQPDGKRGKAQRYGRPSSQKNSAEEETPWFPSITVDGNDVVAVFRVANEAISRARLGRGPTLIECRPFRVNGQRVHDPVRNMEHYLRARGLFDPKLNNRA